MRSRTLPALLPLICAPLLPGAETPNVTCPWGSRLRTDDGEELIVSRPIVFEVTNAK